MSTGQTQGCIDIAISWLALEEYALGESVRADEIHGHLETCSACQSALRSIEEDETRMPSLEIPVRPRGRSPWNWRWRFALIPALGLLLLFFVQRARDEGQGQGDDHGLHGVKGGDSSLELVRERDGVLLDPHYFGPGDRFKLQLSCAPGVRDLYVVVEQGPLLSHPLPVRRVDCGNQVMLPGAFGLEGAAARVCVVFAVHEDRSVVPEDALCVNVQPE